MRSIDQDIQNAPLKAYLRTLILQTVKKYVFQSYQSPSGPVYTRKTLQVFWIHKDCFIWTWHFKTTRRVKTSGMHLSRRTYLPLFSKPLRNIYFCPTSHPLALSTPEKHYNLSNLRRLLDLNMKAYFKTTRGKGLRIPSRATAEIHYLPFTAFHLVANDILQKYGQEKMINVDHTWLSFERKRISTTTCKPLKSDLDQKG